MPPTGRHRAGAAQASREPVSLDEIEEQETPRGRVERPGWLSLLVGESLFRSLLLLIAFSFVLLCLYGWLTYPHLSEVRSAVGGGRESDVLTSWRDMRSDWFNSLKDMGQLFIITPLMPLLGALLGYAFGRQGSDDDVRNSPRSEQRK